MKKSEEIIPASRTDLILSKKAIRVISAQAWKTIIKKAMIVLKI